MPLNERIRQEEEKKKQSGFTFSKWNNDTTTNNTAPAPSVPASDNTYSTPAANNNNGLNIKKNDPFASWAVDASDTDIARRDANLNARFASLSDPSNPLTNPYISATNVHLQELSSLTGIDFTGGIAHDDIESWYKDLTTDQTLKRTVGSATTPPGFSSPGTSLTKKKATQAERDRFNYERIAYLVGELYQNESNTQQAEEQLSNLQKEIKYWVDRTDLNLSDEQILKNIGLETDENGKKSLKNYKKLSEMENNRVNGAASSLNRSVNFTTDLLGGMIWAARNDSKDDAYTNAIFNALGVGKQWEANPDTIKYTDVTSKYYDPFMLSGTMHDMFMKYGVNSFDQKWLDDHKAEMFGTTDYTKIQNAVDYTNACIEEKKAVDSWIDYMIEDGRSYAEIEKELYSAHDFTDKNGNDISTLKATHLDDLDQSIRDGNLKDTTDKIGWNRAETLDRVRERIVERDTSNELKESFEEAFGVTKSYYTDPEGTVNPFATEALKNFRKAVFEYGTEEDRDLAKILKDLDTPDEKNAFIEQFVTSGSISKEEAFYVSARVAEDYAADSYMPNKWQVNQYDSAVQSKADNLAVLHANGYEGEDTKAMQEQFENTVNAVETLDFMKDRAQYFAQYYGYDGNLSDISDVIGYLDYLYKEDYNTGDIDLIAEEAGWHDWEDFSAFLNGSLDTIRSLGVNNTPEVNGNVDLNARAKIPGKDMLDAGWEEFADRQDSYATLYSSTMTGNGMTVLATPIGADGTVYSEENFNNYIDSLLDSAHSVDELLSLDKLENGGRGLLIDVAEGESEKTIQAMDELAESLHRSQEKLYGGGFPEETPLEQYQKTIAGALYGVNTANENIEKYGKGLDEARATLADIEQTIKDLNDYGVGIFGEYTVDENGMTNEAGYKITWGVERADYTILLGDSMLQFNQPVQMDAPQRAAFFSMALTSDDEKTRIDAEEKRATTLKNINKDLESLASYEALLEAYGIKFKDAEGNNLDCYQNFLDYKKNLEDTKFYLEKTLLASKDPDFLKIANQARKDPNNERSYYDPDDGIVRPEYAINGKRDTKYNNSYWMSKQEEDIYYYLKGKGLEEEAEQYREFINGKSGMGDIRGMANLKQGSKELTDEAWYLAYPLTFASNLMAPMGSVYAITQSLTGQEIDPNNQAFWSTAFTSTVRGEMGELVENATGNSGVAKFTLDLVTSGVDSMINSAIWGPVFGKFTEGGKTAVTAALHKITGTLGSTLNMGAQAMSSAVWNAKINGADDDQAMLVGVATMAAETLSEAITFSNIFGAYKAGTVADETLSLGDKFFDVLIRGLKDAPEEALGEMGNEFVEWFTDKQVMGINSEYARTVEEYMSQYGLTRDKAQVLAYKDCAKDVILAGLSGALMGPGTDIVAYSWGNFSTKIGQLMSGRSEYEYTTARLMNEYAALDENLANIEEAVKNAREKFDASNGKRGKGELAYQQSRLKNAKDQMAEWQGKHINTIDDLFRLTGLNLNAQNIAISKLSEQANAPIDQPFQPADITEGPVETPAQSANEEGQAAVNLQSVVEEFIQKTQALNNAYKAGDQEGIANGPTAVREVREKVDAAIAAYKAATEARAEQNGGTPLAEDMQKLEWFDRLKQTAEAIENFIATGTLPEMPSVGQAVGQVDTNALESGNLNEQLDLRGQEEKQTDTVLEEAARYEERLKRAQENLERAEAALRDASTPKGRVDARKALGIARKQVGRAQEAYNKAQKAVDEHDQRLDEKNNTVNSADQVYGLINEGTAGNNQNDQAARQMVAEQEKNEQARAQAKKDLDSAYQKLTDAGKNKKKITLTPAEAQAYLEELQRLEQEASNNGTNDQAATETVPAEENEAGSNAAPFALTEEEKKIVDGDLSNSSYGGNPTSIRISSYENMAEGYEYRANIADKEGDHESAEQQRQRAEEFRNEIARLKEQLMSELREQAAARNAAKEQSDQANAREKTEQQAKLEQALQKLEKARNTNRTVQLTASQAQALIDQANTVYNKGNSREESQRGSGTQDNERTSRPEPTPPDRNLQEQPAAETMSNQAQQPAPAPFAPTTNAEPSSIARPEENVNGRTTQPGPLPQRPVLQGTETQTASTQPGEPQAGAQAPERPDSPDIIRGMPAGEPAAPTFDLQEGLSNLLSGFEQTAGDLFGQIQDVLATMAEQQQARDRQQAEIDLRQNVMDAYKAVLDGLQEARNRYNEWKQAQAEAADRKNKNDQAIADLAEKARDAFSSIYDKVWNDLLPKFKDAQRYLANYLTPRNNETTAEETTQNTGETTETTNEGDTVASEATTPTETTTPAVAPTPADPAAMSIVALSKAQQMDPTTQLAVVTGVLTNRETTEGVVDNEAGLWAGAAANKMLKTFGSTKTLTGMKHAIANAHVYGLDMATFRSAMTTLALSGNNGLNTLRSLFNGQIGIEAALQTAAAISANPETSAAVDNAVTKYAEALERRRLAAANPSYEVVRAESNLETAEATLDAARTALEEKRQDRDHRNSELQDAMNEFDRAMDLPSQTEEQVKAKRAALESASRAVDTATEKLGNAISVVREYEERHNNASRARDTAKQAYDNARQAAYQQYSAQAAQNVAAARAQNAQSIADQLAARNAAAQQATAEAENNAREALNARDTANTDSAAFNAFVEEHFPNASPEQRAHLRETWNKAKAKREGTAPAKKETMPGGVSNSTKGLIDRVSKNLGLEVEFQDLPANVRGYFDKDSNKIVLSNKLDPNDALEYVIFHELTHFAEDSAYYKDLSKYVLDLAYNGNQKQIDADIETRRKLYSNQLGVTFTTDDARKELVAGLMKNILYGEQSLVDKFCRERPSLAERMLLGIQRLLGKLRGVNLPTVQKLQLARDLFEAALAQNAQTAQEQAENTTHPNAVQYSVEQLGRGLRLLPVYGESGNVIGLQTEDGKRVQAGDITPEMVKTTPHGLLIQSAVRANTISQDIADKQLQMISDLANLCLTYPDFQGMIWEIAGEELYSSIKANADKQYGRTVDFGTICAKTQALIDVMSFAMKEKQRGLTRAEVLMAYAETKKQDLSVPCPVCYVFSRWMGVPSLLNSISQWQKRFGSMSAAEITAWLDDLEARYGADVGENESIGDAVNDRKQKLKNKLSGIEDRIAAIEQEMADATQGLQESLTGKTNEEKKNELIRQLDELETEYKELGAYNFVVQAMLETEKVEVGQKTNDDGETKPVTKLLPKRDANGNVILNSAFHVVPDDVLFDMRNTAEFAGNPNYSPVWTFRTTRGAGMSKAIMPYSGFVVGDMVYGNDAIRRQGPGVIQEDKDANGKTNYKANVFLGQNVYEYNSTHDKRIRPKTTNAIVKEGAAAIKNALKRMKAQNVIGGHRLQSTSDYRPEWGLDYMMTFLEMQAVGAKAQLYTKVIEAVDFFASVGAEVNMSAMAKGIGYEMGEDGKLHLIFSDSTGINIDQALEKTGWDSEKGAYTTDKGYDNAQIILVGMNDTHIRLALNDDRITFIIPWHASGNSTDVLSTLIETGTRNAKTGEHETLGNGTDYSPFETDYIIGADNKKKQDAYDKYCKENNIDRIVIPELSKEELKEKERLRDIRKRLLTGKAKAEDVAAIQALPDGLLKDILSDIHHRFYEDKNSEYYEAFLSGDQAQGIFPHEYWDRSADFTGAHVNGERFAAYCEALGIMPRFSMFRNEPGYWKTLIDRRMYGRDGQYHHNQVVDPTNTKVEAIPKEVSVAKYARRNPETGVMENQSATEKAVSNVVANMTENDRRAQEALDNARATLPDQGNNLAVPGRQYDLDLSGTPENTADENTSEGEGVTLPSDDILEQMMLDYMTNPERQTPVRKEIEYSPGNPVIRADRTKPAPQPSGTDSGPVQSGDTIMQNWAKALGIPADTRRRKYERSLRRTTKGYMRQGSGIIHVQDAGNVETAAHEMGHVFDEMFDLRSHADTQAMIDKMSQDPRWAAWLNGYSEAERPGEAIAEVMKNWIIDRNKAINIAGQDFIDYLEKRLDERGWLKPTLEAAEQLRKNRLADSATLAEASVKLEDPKRKTWLEVWREKGWRAAGANVYDYTLDIDHLSQVYKESGKFSDAFDPRTLLLAREGKIKEFTDSILGTGDGKGTLVDPEGNIVKKADGTPWGSLHDILSKIGEEDEQSFNTYLMLMHARDRQHSDIKLLSEMTQEEIAALSEEEREQLRQEEAQIKQVFSDEVDVESGIAIMEQKHPGFKDIAQELYDFYDAFMRTWLVDTGMLPAAEYEAMHKRFPHYVPTFRTGMDANRQTGARPGQTGTNGVRRLYSGGTTNLYNPVMGLVEYMQRYIASYEQNEILRSLDSMFSDPAINTRGIAEVAQDDITLDYQGATVANAVKNLQDYIDGLQQNGIALPDTLIEGLLKAVAETDPKVWIHKNANDNDVINVRLADGTYRSWTVYDTSIVRALTFMPSTAAMSRATSIFRGLNSFLCSMATSKSLSFGLFNFMSDSGEALATGHSAYTWVDYMGHLFKSFWDLGKNKFADFTGNEVDETYRLFKLFGQMGSRYAFRAKDTQTETRKNLYNNSSTTGEKLAGILYGGKNTTVGEKLKKLMTAPVRAIASVNDFLEDLTRYNEFRVASENGMADLSTYEGRLRAGRLGREVTVDFSKRGYNETITAARTFVPFLNASIQGTAKALTLFTKENEGNRIKIAARIVVNTMLVNAVATFLRGMTWDDDDKEAYDQLSDYEQNKYFHIKVGDEFIRIKRSQNPLIQLGAAFGNLIGSTMTGFEDNPLGDFAGVCREIANNMLIDPTQNVLSPFIDAANNRTYWGGQIENSTMQEMDVANRYNPDDKGNVLYRMIGAVLGVSPAKVDYVIGQYTGSLGVVGSRWLSAAIGNAQEGERADEVILGSLVDSVRDRLAERFSIDPVETNRINSTYKDMLGMLEGISNAADEGMTPAQLRGNLTEAEQRKAISTAKEMMKSGGKIGRIKKDISSLWKKYFTAKENKNYTDERKEQEMRDIRKQLNEKMLKANEIIGDYFTEYGHVSPIQYTWNNIVNAAMGKD